MIILNGYKPFGSMQLGGGEIPIVRWEVWWVTMRGHHKTLAEALVHAEETEMPPEMIRPVPVAIGPNDEWEPLYR